MHTICQDSRDFLEILISSASLRLSVNAVTNQNTCLLNIEGEDSGLLLATGGELLEALEHIVNKAFIQQLPQSVRIVCDVHNYRLNRQNELKTMALHASDQVSRTQIPFVFAVMNANERRVIHETLAGNPLVMTESIGEGNARRLKVSPKN